MMQINNSKRMFAIIMILASILYISTIYMLNKPDAVATAASKVIFAKAHVTELVRDEAREDMWTEGLRLGTQEIVVFIDSGIYKGEEIQTYNYLSAYGNVDAKVGTKIIVRLDADENNVPYITSIASYDRSTMLITLTLIFVGLLVLLGGKKGVSAVVGLSFTIFSIWFLLIPLIKRGVPAMFAAIILVAITTFVSLVALNGFSKKTWIAVAGCVGGVSIAGLIVMLASVITPINGFNMSEAEELVLRATDEGLKISGLLVSGILIASLGAVMDISLMITSAVSELHAMNPEVKSAQLFKSGLSIGRDAMGTMANTLILAFAGASLNMLILFRVFNYPYLQIFNSDLMSIEIIQGLAGSIGIVLTVPLVAALSAYFYGKKTI